MINRPELGFSWCGLCFFLFGVAISAICSRSHSLPSSRLSVRARAVSGPLLVVVRRVAQIEHLVAQSAIFFPAPSSLSRRRYRSAANRAHWIALVVLTLAVNLRKDHRRNFAFDLSGVGTRTSIEPDEVSHKLRVFIHHRRRWIGGAARRANPLHPRRRQSSARSPPSCPYMIRFIPPMRRFRRAPPSGSASRFSNRFTLIVRTDPARLVRQPPEQSRHIGWPIATIVSRRASARSDSFINESIRST